MSFKTELTVEGKTYPVRSCYTAIHRDTDKRGRPSSMLFWYAIITIDATDDTTITNWMIDPSKQVEGQLVIYKIDEESKLKEIKFKKSYCIYMMDRFMSDQSYTCCEIVITGGELHIDSAKLILQ